MKNIYSLLVALLFMGTAAQAQNFRYVKDMFTDAQITVESDITYGTNIDFLTSSLDNPANIGRDITEIKTALATGNPIPAKFYNPADTNTDLKVTDIKYDIYYPDGAADSETNRPVMVYLHTGNFLPPCINKSPLGLKTDEIAKSLCMAMARKGYVAVSADYRLGWNPISDLEPVRKGTLLNAVYRAVQDAKQCIRVVKKEGKGTNKYGIDPNRIFIAGEGTGAYVALAVNALDKYEEVTYDRFLNPVNGKPYIDTLNVGNVEGFGGTLNLYAPNGETADISACINLGAAMPDTNWMESDDAPYIAFQCVRDPFAPFDVGIVIVPTTGESVLEVQGANRFIDRANRMGINDALYSDTINDAVSNVARSRYGQTYDYIYPAPRNKMTVNANSENLFPVVIPLGASIFNNTSQPWQFWDTASPLAKCLVKPNATSDMAARQSNPNASPEVGALWVDTITSYVCPRLANLYGFVGVEDTQLNERARIFPNPTEGKVNVELAGTVIESINVLDINGRVVHSTSSNRTSSLELDLSTLRTGIYILEIRSEDGTAFKKLSLK